MHKMLKTFFTMIKKFLGGIHKNPTEFQKNWQKDSKKNYLRIEQDFNRIQQWSMKSETEKYDFSKTDWNR